VLNNSAFNKHTQTKHVILKLLPQVTFWRVRHNKAQIHKLW